MSITRKKLEEAKYFLGQMQVYVEDRKKFAFNLSAFLSATRSVTFFMQSEFKSFLEFSEWYYKDKQKEMNKDGDFKFFNELRRTTIHKKPVVSHKKTAVGISETISLSESIIAVLTDKEGNVISKQTSPATTSKPKKTNLPKETKVTVKYSWYFGERPNENLLELCNNYIQKIKKLVEECEKQFHKD